MTVDGERITVLIVDDHQVVRQGLRTFLELQDDIEVVGEAEDGAAAVELVARMRPDVVLMDLVMPVLDGVGATRKVVELDVGAKVIVLTSFAGDGDVFRPSRPGRPVTCSGRLARRSGLRHPAVHRGEPRFTLPSPRNSWRP